MDRRQASRIFSIGTGLSLLPFVHVTQPRGVMELLNVSYDPTRELYREINEAFAASWQAHTGEEVVIRMSHGGSGRQARSVIGGRRQGRVP